jgi:hypothetical protein
MQKQPARLKAAATRTFLLRGPLGQHGRLEFRVRAVTRGKIGGFQSPLLYCLTTA